MLLFPLTRKSATRRAIRQRVLATTAVATILVSLIGLQPAYAAASQTALDPAVVPEIDADPDTSPVELGMRFSSTTDGVVESIRFYKGVENQGVHTGSLWTSSGDLLAQTTFRNETASGWQTAALTEPVAIESGESYVVSYHTPRGRYSSTIRGFAAASSRGDLTVPAGAGVYSYGETAFPTNSWQNSNYFVDVNFTATAAPPTDTPPPSVGMLREIDGGQDYFEQFPNSLPSDPDYFPVGVWFESILDEGDVALDQAAGLNLYVELTSNSDTSLLGPTGMSAITGNDMPGAAGRLTTDEADMWGGPGSAAWTGNDPGQGPICVPTDAQCGYTIMETLRARIAPDTLAYTNYGKGVTFWESDEEAARFVNSYQDVVSADNYWFTDPNICGASEGGKLVGGRPLTTDECRLAANYGWTVDRVRSLVEPAGSIPVWAFVEVGHPFSESSAPTITGPEIRAAVWSSIIHGAQGVIYFNHNFGGDCITQHVLRHDCGQGVRAVVTAVNAQIKALAPVLNAPYLDGVTTASAGVDQMTKIHDGQVYVFAGSNQNASQSASITNACFGSGPVTVVGEDRIIGAVNGTVSDAFTDGNAVHIYSAPAAARCLE